MVDISIINGTIHSYNITGGAPPCRGPEKIQKTPTVSAILRFPAGKSDAPRSSPNLETLSHLKASKFL